MASEAPAAAGEDAASSSASSTPSSSSENYVVPAAVRILSSHRSTYYLVGTAHVSSASCSDVRALIAAVHPDVVFLELCPERKGLLAEKGRDSESGSCRSEPAAQPQQSLWAALAAARRGDSGVLEAVYAWVLGRVGGALEAAPGQEFREAVLAAQEVGARVVLGDRPVRVTLARMWAALPLWHRLTFLGSLLGLGLCASPDMRNEVEALKEGDALEEALVRCAAAYPTLLRPLLAERDEYMAAMLRKLALRPDVGKVVAVVGCGHLDGIEAAWGREIDAAELMRLPEGSQASSKAAGPIRFSLLTWQRVGLASLCGVGLVSLVVGVRTLRPGGSLLRR